MSIRFAITAIRKADDCIKDKTERTMDGNYLHDLSLRPELGYAQAVGYVQAMREMKQIISDLLTTEDKEELKSLGLG